MINAAVLIQAYNPCCDLARLMQEMTTLGMPVVIINERSDAPSPSAPAALSEPEHCHVLHVNRDESRGHALKEGIAYIFKNYSDISGVITVNPDENFSAQDILAVARAMEPDRTEILLGCRTREGAKPATEPVLNRIIRISYALLAGIKAANPRTGLRGFPASVLPWILEHQPEHEAYALDVLLIARRHGVAIKQIALEPPDLRRPLKTQSITFTGFLRIYALLFMFSLSSLVSYLFDIGMYALLIATVFSQSQNDLLTIFYCTVIARVFSSFFNFAINKRIVFRDTRSDYTIIVRYITLTILRMFASVAGVYAITTALGIDSRIVKVAVDLVLFFVGFRLQQNWVFSKPANP